MILRDSERQCEHPCAIVTSICSDDIVIGCVTEDNPKYLGQALRLLQSIRWFGGELARVRVVVGSVERIDPAARRALEALDARVRIVPRFEPRNGSANRLALFDEHCDGSEQNFLLLDCDTIVVRDPLPLLRRGVLQARIAPLPTVTHEVFQRLFAYFGLELPPRSHLTGYSGTPTIPYFNAGVINVAADLGERLAPPWRKYNAILAGRPELVAPCERHLHQAALALAVADTGIPVDPAGAELNYQLNMTQLPPPPGYLDVDPCIIHYHHLVDEEGILRPCPFPRAQERIDRFHERLRRERRLASGLSRSETGPATSPKQIAVIGMHRSGTSLVARLLNAMSCYAGREDELPPPDVFNPTGYWERRDVWALDEEILATLDCNWIDGAAADLSRLSADSRRVFADRARAIADALDEHGSWVIKDPRLSLLFPLWRCVLRRPICVLVWRQPQAVARSIQARDGLPLVLGLALWEEYNRAMLATTIGLPRVMVSYDDLVADPIATASRLHAELIAAGAADLRLPSDDRIRAMIDPQLNRHGGDDDLLLTGHQSELRDALRSNEALQWSSVTPTLPETRALLSGFTRAEREKAMLLKENAESRMLIDAVFSSRSWRLGFALTRIWRRLVRSGEPTAVDRWRERSGQTPDRTA
jgi:hypothetical protein